MSWVGWCLSSRRPTGLGLDVGMGWVPGLDSEEEWRPLFRFTAGAFFFGSGGAVLGRDYQANGFRLNLEAGLLRGIPLTSGFFRWGFVGGVQAIGLVHVEPCGAGDDCSDARIGPSLRAEAMLVF